MMERLIYSRVITVPHQTPLSAGIAFAETARRTFIPLEKMLKENILNHYLIENLT